MVKKILAVIVLGTAAVAAQAEPLNYDLVNLQADARASVPNDLMLATLFVEVDSKDATQLAAEVTRTVNQAMKAAQAERNVKVSSGNRSSWPVHDAKNKVVAWRSRAELRLESRDFEAAARAIAAMQAGMQLAGVQFALAPETAAAQENALIEKAMAAFSARADLVAKSLGAKSWRTVNINVGSNSNPPPMPYVRGMAMKTMAEEMPVQDVAGGESETSVSINGSVQLQQ